MKILYKILLLTPFALLANNQPNAFGQLVAGDAVSFNISEMALIDTNHPTITMSLPSSVAGASITQSTTNTDMWIRLTSVTDWWWRRAVYASVSGTIPPGTTLKLRAASATSANSAGDLGRVRGEVTLSSSSQQIIYRIRDCYTGNGPGDGYQLTYTWALNNPSSNFGLLEANPTTTVTVYFTITAQGWYY